VGVPGLLNRVQFGFEANDLLGSTYFHCSDKTLCQPYLKDGVVVSVKKPQPIQTVIVVKGNFPDLIEDFRGHHVQYFLFTFLLCGARAVAKDKFEVTSTINGLNPC